MDNSIYTTLTRQSGLMTEMRSVANNVANASTTGYRAESVTFAEHISNLGAGHRSLSMATLSIRQTSVLQGTLTNTGGTFDLAIEGEGYFLIQTPNGERLTRAGAFLPDANGDLVTVDGHQVLDAGGSPVFVPPGANSIGIAPDGTLSADGQPMAQIGIVAPNNPQDIIREDASRFRADSGFVPVTDPQVVQGYLEESNVNPIEQITRMIEVQRAYELGQNFADKEDERIRGVIRTLGR